jgi:glycosyltransferase involved in cell wall biosynthesis
MLFRARSHTYPRWLRHEKFLIRVAFLFSRPVPYPPDFNTIKAFYVTQELMGRGIKVSWLGLGSTHIDAWSGGIEFVGFGANRARLIGTINFLRSIFNYCRKNGVRLIYVDEWLFLRENPAARLFLQLLLKISGAKFVLDQRDPYIDFEVACGRLKVGSAAYQVARFEYNLIYRFCDLIILPSKAYANALVRDGVPRGKVAGILRGVDTKAFNVKSDGMKVRRELGLDSKFVIGWFGIMHEFRLIREVLVPLVRMIKSIAPNSHIVIGGKGPASAALEKLRSEETKEYFSYVGVIPYERLPSYLAACDVLLCPVSTGYRLTMNSAWLKIMESIAVGKPIIATRTLASLVDYRDMQGVLWVGSDVGSFRDAILTVRKNYPAYLNQALMQSRNFANYSMNNTVSSLVDRLLQLLFQSHISSRPIFNPSKESGIYFVDS